MKCINMFHIFQRKNILRSIEFRFYKVVLNSECSCDRAAKELTLWIKQEETKNKVEIATCVVATKGVE